jgi:hypothetical protein
LKKEKKKARYILASRYQIPQAIQAASILETQFEQYVPPVPNLSGNVVCVIETFISHNLKMILHLHNSQPLNIDFHAMATA